MPEGGGLVVHTAGQAEGGALQLALVLGEEKGGAHTGCRGGKDGGGGFLPLAYHHGHAGLHDAGLLGGYQLEGAAQKLGVVQTDVGNHAHLGGDDVGAVETAAQSYFHHGDVYMLLGEVFEGQGGGELEEGRMKGLEEGALLLHEVYHILLADAHTVHTDALPEVHQVGRGVKAYLEALGLKDGGQTV